MRETFEKTKFNKNKGITLLSLILTIIILLILAGVSISMLSGESGILKNANDSKVGTDEAEEAKNVEMAVLTALTASGNGEITSDSAMEILRKKLEEAGCQNAREIEELPAVAKMEHKKYKINKYGDISEPSEIEKLISSGEPVDSKTTLTDDNGDTITIPEGFKIAEDSATLVADGIVVVAPDKSEFVWVPVTDITKMAKTAKEGGTDTKGRTNYQGILYDFKSEGGVYSATEKASYGQGTESYREPDYLSNTSYGDAVTGNSKKGVELLKSIVGLSGTDEEILSKWKTQLQEEYNEMVESVKVNQGFYVGRYETSLDDSENKNAQSIAKKESATGEKDSANTWYGLYQKQKEYSTKEYKAGETLENIVGSSMIWGSQYDQMMIWMQENGIDVTSTDSEKLKGAEINTSSKTTGIDEDKDILNNVYDILGCQFEWTLEANDTNIRINRAGYCYNSSSPCYRRKYSPYCTDSFFGSRLTLYVK